MESSEPLRDISSKWTALLTSKNVQKDTRVACIATLRELQRGMKSEFEDDVASVLCHFVDVMWAVGVVVLEAVRVDGHALSHAHPLPLAGDGRS